MEQVNYIIYYKVGICSIWAGGQRECPSYIIGMMDEILSQNCHE